MFNYLKFYFPYSFVTQGKFSDEYICELCQKKDKGSWTKPWSKDSAFQLELSPDSSEAIEIEKTTSAGHAAPVSELPRSYGKVCAIRVKKV